MIARHNAMKEDLEMHINKIHMDKLELQKQFEDAKLKLSEERESLLNELQKRKNEHEMIVTDTMNKIDDNKRDIERLTVVNHNCVEDKHMKESELEKKKLELTQELDALRVNNAILLKEKEDKIAYLSSQSGNLTKEKNLKTELNKEL